ncbi:phosphatase 6 regulatory subunit 1-like protein fmt isoform X2 [Leptinotarsa decemlineata]|uniref:phosphatase 6 regulatory subunit 1-like protein fmt isoform X2 n=1 Tax=Leptinotarsa decemlineata TaxID=7539 RepID=UPI003D306EF5
MRGESAIMFWKYNNLAQIEALVNKENVTLLEVLEFEDILSECKTQNKILLDYLQKTEVMDGLLTLITTEPSNEIEERTRYRIPNLACEILTCDVSSMNEKLAKEEVLLNKLYSFLERDAPLNPLLACYFCKLMSALVVKKNGQNWLSYQMTCLQVLDFLKSKDTFIPYLLKHIGAASIMDLVLKLMTQVETVDTEETFASWLNSQGFIQSLVSLFKSEVEKERHFNVAMLLCDFIRIARDDTRNATEKVEPDILLLTLESPQTISILLDSMLSGNERSESAVAGGIQVLQAILDVYQTSYKFSPQNMYNSNMDDEAEIEQKQKIIFNTTQAIKHRIKDLHNILVHPPKLSPIQTTAGTLNPPLGYARIQIVKLFATLIPSDKEEILNELELAGTFPVLLELFFKYQWNNILHSQVEACFVSALKTLASDDSDDSSNALIKHLFVDCKLIETILSAWKENDEHQKQENGGRKGYMGHLINIINEIVDVCSNTSLGQYLTKNLPEVAKSLEEFKESTLKEVNRIQDTMLGDAPPQVSTTTFNNFEDIPFPQSSAVQQQVFSQYQMQNLSPQYIDGYSGFNDDEFTDGEDTLQNIDHRTQMNFDVSESDLIQQQEIFKQVCAQNINTLDDADDQIFEEREHTFQTVIEKHDRNETAYSSDSDDEPGEDTMDADPWESPKTSSIAPVIGSDPWNPEFTSSDTTIGEWADFSSVLFVNDCVGVNDDANKKDVSKEPAVEKDLKLENVEDEANMPKNTLTDSINSIAQTDGVKPNVAGDRGDEPLPSDQRAAGTVAEPSKSIQEGDCNTLSGSAEQEKVKKEKV